MSAPPNWRPDPTGRHEHRYWDGSAWTDQVANDGVWSIAPMVEPGKPGRIAKTVGGTVDQLKTDMTRDLVKWKRKLKPPSGERQALERARSARAVQIAAYRRRVADAQAVLAAALDPQPIKICGGLRLYTTKIDTPEGTFPLTPAIHATVETAGNLHSTERSTGTRMVGGALLGGAAGAAAGAAARKTTIVDARELYLLIDGGTWYQTHPYAAVYGAHVRDFALALNVTARNVESVPDQATTVEQRTAELTAAKRSYHDAARAHYEVLSLERMASPQALPESS